jgi:hypothetical protein
MDDFSVSGEIFDDFSFFDHSTWISTSTSKDDTDSLERCDNIIQVDKSAIPASEDALIQPIYGQDTLARNQSTIFPISSSLETKITASPTQRSSQIFCFGLMHAFNTADKDRIQFLINRYAKMNVYVVMTDDGKRTTGRGTEKLMNIFFKLLDEFPDIVAKVTRLKADHKENKEVLRVKYYAAGTMVRGPIAIPSSAEVSLISKPCIQLMKCWFKGVISIVLDRNHRIAFYDDTCTTLTFPDSAISIPVGSY